MVALKKKWLVYRNNEVLGPFEADEIRNALRTGDIRAFDMVGLENSSIRRPLVEVDEIFETKSMSYVEAQERGLPYQPQPLSPDMQKVSHGYLGGAINQASKPAKPAARKKIAKPRRSPKKYFVHRHNNIVGPLSAKEIMQAYEKGTLPRDAKIQKNGRSQKLSVDKFIERYREARGATNAFSQLPVQFNKKPPGTLTKMALGQSIRNRNLIWVMGMSLIGTLLVVGFLAVILTVDKKRSSQVAGRTQMRQTPVRRVVAPPPPPVTRRVQASKPVVKKVVKPKPKRAAPKKVARVVRKKSTPKKAKPRRTYKRPVSRAKPVAKKPVTRTRYTPKPAKRVAVSRPKPKPARVVTRPSRPAPQRSVSSGARLGIIGGNLASREDSTVRLGPLGYSIAELDACGGICQIFFKDARGNRIKVKFFKNSFYQQLKNKKGAAVIQGTVRKGGTELLLKDVR